jgi:4-amino-4-deoxy-L-arabinose transferase-like glycosyltransferase
MENRRFHGWIVGGVAALVLLTRLGAAPLWDDDEPKNAACSLAMLDAGDWVVPTFAGHLRIEKPPLVNWLHIAGIAACGRTETGVRIGSALLTIGTCLLTWRIGTILLSPAVGLLGGLAMATCIWTAVGGRASTPDAPLVFFTTLVLYLVAREVVRGHRQEGPLRLSAFAAIAIGAAGGAAVLAKGPIGFVIPATACAMFAAIQAGTGFAAIQAGTGFAAIQASAARSLGSLFGGLRPLTVTAAMLAVAAPWHAWVAIRTDGDWLRGFFLVHNVGRFAAPMEGHSGSLLFYPLVIGIGLFPWSIVLLATLAHLVAAMRSVDRGQRLAMHLLACWIAAWIGILSLAGTKLPGYVWPAYPALAVATGAFLDAWQRHDIPWLRWSRNPTRLADAIMHIGLLMLLTGGIVVAVGLPLAARRWAPGGEWLGVFGLVPALAAGVGWWAVRAGRPRRAVMAVAVAGCLLTLSLATVAAPRIGREATPRALFAPAEIAPLSEAALATYRHAPPSLVFYRGGPVPILVDAADVTRHFASRSDAVLVVDTRFLDEVRHCIPASHGTVAETRTVSARHLLLIGPLPSPPVAVNGGSHQPSAFEP